MFGLIMGIALGIGGIVTGVKHISQNSSSEKRALRNYLNGNNPSQTYYDNFVGSDIDLFSGRKVTRKNLDWSGDEYIVDDRTGKILRNATMERRISEANYQRSCFGKRDICAYSYGKLQKMWGEKAFNRVPGYTIGNHPQDITDIRMHCKTKKLGYIIMPYQIKGLEERIIFNAKEIFDFDKINIGFNLRCLFDLYTGNLIDFTWYKKEYSIEAIIGEEKRFLTDYEIEEIVKKINEDFKKGILKRKLSGWEVLFQ